MEGKYGKLLTALLIVVVIIVVGLLIFLGYDVISGSKSKRDIAEALDNYEINVIDLSSIEIWTNKGTKEDKPSLNSRMSNDFVSINKMISNSKKTKVVICLPQNINYHWKYYDEFSLFWCPSVK